MFESYDNAAQCGPVEGGSLMQLSKSNANSMKARISRAVEQAQIRLDDAKRAQEILTKNPDLEELLNIMQRGGI